MGKRKALDPDPPGTQAGDKKRRTMEDQLQMDCAADFATSPPRRSSQLDSAMDEASSFDAALIASLEDTTNLTTQDHDPDNLPIIPHLRSFDDPATLKGSGRRKGRQSSSADKSNTASPKKNKNAVAAEDKSTSKPKPESTGPTEALLRLSRGRYTKLRVRVIATDTFYISPSNMAAYCNMANAGEFLELFESEWAVDWLVPFREELAYDNFGASIPDTPHKAYWSIDAVFSEMGNLWAKVGGAVKMSLPLPETVFPKILNDTQRGYASWVRVVQSFIDEHPQYTRQEPVPADEMLAHFRREDIHRAIWAIKCYLHREHRKEKAQPHTVGGGAHSKKSRAEPLEYMTDAQLHGFTSQNQVGLSKVNLAIGFNDEFAKSIKDDVLMSHKFSAEQREDILEALSSDLMKGTAAYASATRENSAARPLIDPAGMPQVLETIGQMATVMYPTGADMERLNSDKSAAATRDNLMGQENIMADFTHPSGDLDELREPAASSIVEPRQYTAEERAVFLKFNADQIKSKITMPTFVDSAAYWEIKLADEPVGVPMEAPPDDDGAWLKSVAAYVQPEVFPGLHLKPHQLTGVTAMSLMEDSFIGGSIVGDEMGLGKTVEALTLIVLKANLVAKLQYNPILRGRGIMPDNVYKPTLVAPPAGALDTWLAEIQSKFADKLILKYFYSNRNACAREDRELTIGVTAEDLEKEVSRFDVNDPATARVVFITSLATYAHRIMAPPFNDKATADGVDEIQAASDGDAAEVIEGDAAEEEKFESSATREFSAKYAKYINKAPDLFDRIIVDEAHTVKGEGTLAQRAIRTSNFRAIHLLTGTPIKNHAKDLAGLLNIIHRPDMGFLPNSEVRKSAYTDAAVKVAAWNTLPFSAKMQPEAVKPLLNILDPLMFRMLADPSVSGQEMTADLGAAMLPPVYGMVLIKRGRGTVVDCNGYQVRTASEVGLPHVITVELDPTPFQKKYLSQCLVEEISAMGGSQRQRSRKQGGPSTTFNTRATRRLVFNSFSTSLEFLYRHANIASDLLGGLNTDSDDMCEFWHRCTREVAYHNLTRDRIGDAKNSAILSAKTCHVMNRIRTWVYEEGRKMILFFNWPHTLHDMANSLATLGIKFLVISADQLHSVR